MSDAGDRYVGPTLPCDSSPQLSCYCLKSERSVNFEQKALKECILNISMSRERMYSENSFQSSLSGYCTNESCSYSVGKWDE